MTSRILWALAALLAIAGFASAQSPCPECDPDGEPDNSTYSSIDTGLLHGDDHVLVDTDSSYGEKDDGTMFTWFAFCFSVFLAQLEEMLEMDVVDFDLWFEAYNGEDGSDLDGGIMLDGETIADLDETPAGDLDDATWGLLPETGVGLPEDDIPYEGVDEDLCLDLEAVAPAGC